MLIKRINFFHSSTLRFFWILVFAGVSVILLSLAGCKKSNTENQTHQQIVTVKTQETATNLYYAGTIEPLKVNPVVSPVDGTIEKMNFSYGHKVTKGQLLAVVLSEKLQKDYRDALTNYLKAKNDFQQEQASFVGTTELWKAGIIDNETYSKEKESLASAELAYLNAQIDLLSTVRVTPRASETLVNLDLNNFSAIKQVLNQSINRLNISADANGIALFPPKSTEDKSIQVGSEVKQGQVIVNIGDLSGVKIQINVDEVHIDEIKEGQAAIITSEALPELKLNGKVSSVAAQAKTDEVNLGAASFDVNVEVPTLTAEEEKQIRVGMDATVAISLATKPRILLPLKAVKTVDGQSTVEVLLANGQSTIVPVKTGATTLDSVEIISGLKPGDKVIVND